MSNRNDHPKFQSRREYVRIPIRDFVFGKNEDVGRVQEPIEDPQEQTENSEPSDSEAFFAPEANGDVTDKLCDVMDLEVLYLSAVLNKSGISETQATLLVDEFASVATGARSKYSYPRDIKPFVTSIVNKHAIEKVIICDRCNTVVANKLCGSNECKDLRKAKKVGSAKTSLLFFPQLRLQLQEIVSRNFNSFLEFSLIVHRNRQAYEKTWIQQLHNLTNDNRAYPFFLRRMETETEFNTNVIVIQLGISFDGVKLKRISRNEAWPLYIEIISLPSSDRSKIENGAIAALYCSSRKPSKYAQKVIVDRIKFELSSLISSPIIVKHNNINWTVKFLISTGFLDLAAQQLVFGLPKWNSLEGCSKCKVNSHRINNYRSWRWDRMHPVQLRSRDSFLSPERWTPFMEILTPADCSVDWLHVCQEGIMKDRLKDLLGKSGKLLSIKLTKAQLSTLDQYITSIQSITYESCPTLSMADFSKLTGSELESLHNVAMPLAASIFASNIPVTSLIILIGQWIVIKLISDLKYGQFHEQIDISRECVQRLVFLIGLKAPEILTMKLHLLLEHFIERDVEIFGPPHGTTTSTSERWHKTLMVEMNQNAGNGLKATVERYLAAKTMRAIINRLCQYPIPGSIEEKLSNIYDSKSNRFPPSIIITQDVYIPVNSSNIVLNIFEGDASLKKFISSSISSRVVVKGLCITSKYWTRSVESSSRVICYRRPDGSVAFGFVVFFEYTAVLCFAVVRNYSTSSPFSKFRLDILALENIFERDLCLPILNVVEKTNTYFMKVDRYLNVEYVNVNDILSLASQIEYQGQCFVSRK